MTMSLSSSLFGSHDGTGVVIPFLATLSRLGSIFFRQRVKQEVECKRHFQLRRGPSSPSKTCMTSPKSSKSNTEFDRPRSSSTQLRFLSSETPLLYYTKIALKNSTLSSFKIESWVLFITIECATAILATTCFDCCFLTLSQVNTRCGIACEDITTRSESCGSKGEPLYSAKRSSVFKDVWWEDDKAIKAPYPHQELLINPSFTRPYPNSFLSCLVSEEWVPWRKMCGFTTLSLP